VAGVDTCKAGTSVPPAFGGETQTPTGVATDAAGNVYVAETNVHNRIQKSNSSGNFQRAWGEDVASAGPGDTPAPNDFEICVATTDTCQAGTTVGAALGGELNFPVGVATDAAGNVYVADTDHNRIQKFDSSGNFQRAWGEDVASAGPGDTPAPDDFEICVAGVDTCKIGTNGTPVGTPVAQGGEMNQPNGVATDAAGNVYVADTGHNRIQKFDSSGNFQRAWGEDVASAGPGNTGVGFEICVAGVDTCKTGETVGAALGGEMNIPFGVATDAAGNVYVADQGHNRIQKFAADPVAPDLTAPSTALGSAKIKRSSRKATFRFSSNEPGSTFLCKIDKKPFLGCSSPKTYKKLKKGKHKFQVQARDAAGNLDATPVVKKFRI
jgi:sugar lactone lactonase YvrE